MPKPGPRSTKRNVIVQNRGTLGESSISDDDDSADNTAAASEEKENRTPREQRLHNRSKPIEAATSFRTPDNDQNATDYGLEFTTSQIPNPSPRRCSTLKTHNSQEERGTVHRRTENETETSDESADIDSGQNAGTGREMRVSSEEETEIPTIPSPKKPAKKATQQKKIDRPKTKQQQAQERQQTRTAKDTTTASKAMESYQQSANDKSKTNEPIKKRRKQKTPLQMNRNFLREVKKLQNRTDLLIPRQPFSRVIREIMMDASQMDLKITPTALEALQTATEMYVTQRMQDAYMLTLHRGRVTLEARDMELINYLKMYL